MQHDLTVVLLTKILFNLFMIVCTIVFLTEILFNLFAIKTMLLSLKFSKNLKS